MVIREITAGVNEIFFTARVWAAKIIPANIPAKIKGMLKDYLGWGGLDPDLQNYKGLTKD